MITLQCVSPSTTKVGPGGGWRPRRSSGSEGPKRLVCQCLNAVFDAVRKIGGGRDRPWERRLMEMGEGETAH